MPVARRQRQNRQKKKKQRDWKQIAWYVISGLVALSMASAYVISYLASR